MRLIWYPSPARSASYAVAATEGIEVTASSNTHEISKLGSRSMTTNTAGDIARQVRSLS